MTDGLKEWMVGLPDHSDLLSIEDLQCLIRDGQVRETDLVRRTGETWHAARDFPELEASFPGREDLRRKTRRRPLKDFDPSAPLEAPPLRDSVRPTEAMEGKYYSPTDLLRAVSHGMAPRNLILSALFLVPTLSSAMLLREFISSSLVRYGVITLLIGLGVSGVTFLLAHITRCQIEGANSGIAPAIGTTLRRLPAVFSLPLIVLLPAAFFFSVLFFLGRIGASSEEAAQTLRIFYFVPVLAGLLLVGCFIFLELLLIMVPSCMVVENISLGSALRNVRYYLRKQPGRVLFHWLLITVGCSMSYRIVSYFVAKGFSFAAEMTGGPLPAGSVWASIYSGVREGLGLAIPISVFATMSVLSILVLREADMEYVPEGEGAGAEETHPSTGD